MVSMVRAKHHWKQPDLYKDFFAMHKNKAGPIFFWTQYILANKSKNHRCSISSMITITTRPLTIMLQVVLLVEMSRASISIQGRCSLHPVKHRRKNQQVYFSYTFYTVFAQTHIFFYKFKMFVHSNKSTDWVSKIWSLPSKAEFGTLDAWAEVFGG